MVAHAAEAEIPKAFVSRLEGGCGWREALFAAFLGVDARLQADSQFADSSAGCTACVVAFDGRDKLVAANLGRALHHHKISTLSFCWR